MLLYTPKLDRAGVWPEPLEGVWQQLRPGSGYGLSQVAHLSLSDELFIGAITAIARPERPWGAISWLAEEFGVSRPTVYALGERIVNRLRSPIRQSKARMPVAEEEAEEENKKLIRTALSGAFPGNMALRPMQAVLKEAFGQTRSIGTLSQLLTESGRRAGEVLRQVDHSPLGPVIVVRDETYFQEWPFLIVIEPVSSVILLAEVSPDCQAETWGAALLVAQDQGVSITGLVEDMARMYPKSQELAEVDVAVQKDTWHVSHAGGQVRRDLQREALSALRKVDKLEKKLLKQWDGQLFDEKYIPAVEKLEGLLEQHDTFEAWFGHLCDALELVDIRSGDIRDRDTNSWLLDETLAAMTAIDHLRVKSFVKTLRRHQDQLLTFLDWISAALLEYQMRLAEHVGDPLFQHLFIRAAAHVWRLRQALINGHRGWRGAAQEAEDALQTLIGDDEELAWLASDLMTLLDAAGHTSSLIECINGLLKSFLKNRRAFRNIDTAQAYLNLFVLWHNMRVYQRGKRAGKSPFQWAGIDPGCDDWLDLLGYPAC